MSRVALHLEATVFCHATESLEKVKSSLLNILPEDMRKQHEGKVSIETLESFFGNPIYVLRLSIDDCDLASDLFRALLIKLGREGINELSATLEQRLDSSGRLHVRFDKQQAFVGRLKVYDGDDVIKVRVKLSRQALDEIRAKGLDALLRR